MNDSGDTRDPYMVLLRELVEAYQAFEGYAIPHIKAQGLTPAQFDVIATLGNTNGMTFKELGQRTLLYKTTLTSVVDRLEARGWVVRVPSRDDRRSTIARLTREGEALFERVFPAHRDYLKERFAQLGMEDTRAGIAFLRQLRTLFRDEG